MHRREFLNHLGCLGAGSTLVRNLGRVLERAADVRVIGIGPGGRDFIAKHCHGLGWMLMGLDRVDERPLPCSPAQAYVGLYFDEAEPYLSSLSAPTALHFPAIGRYLQGAGIVIVIAELGGQSESVLAPAVAAIARRGSACTVAIAITPFEFEGPWRTARAQAAGTRLRRESDLTIEISRQRLLELHGTEDASLEDLEEFCAQGERQAVALLANTWPCLGLREPVDFRFPQPDDRRALRHPATGATLSTELEEVLCSRYPAIFCDLPRLVG